MIREYEVNDHIPCLEVLHLIIEYLPSHPIFSNPLQSDPFTLALIACTLVLSFFLQLHFTFPELSLMWLMAISVWLLLLLFIIDLYYQQYTVTATKYQ